MRSQPRTFVIASIVFCVATLSAQAQIAAPPVPSILAPAPVPSAPPPPAIEVPPVPKMDAPTPTPKAKADPRRSFNDRLIGCLQSTDAMQLRPGDRVAFSRYCANRVE